MCVRTYYVLSSMAILVVMLAEDNDRDRLKEDRRRGGGLVNVPRFAVVKNSMQSSEHPVLSPCAQASNHYNA